MSKLVILITGYGTWQTLQPCRRMDIRLIFDGHFVRIAAVRGRYSYSISNGSFGEIFCRVGRLDEGRLWAVSYDGIVIFTDWLKVCSVPFATCSCMNVAWTSAMKRFGYGGTGLVRYSLPKSVESGLVGCESSPIGNGIWTKRYNYLWS